mgnify:CR=1 FL=1
MAANVAIISVVAVVAVEVVVVEVVVVVGGGCGGDSGGGVSVAGSGEWSRGHTGKSCNSSEWQQQAQQ